MPLTKKLLLLLCQSMLLWLLVFLFAQSPQFTAYYSRSFYPLVQEGKSLIFRHIPFSVGDVLYILAAFWLFITLVRWAYFIGKYGSHKDRLWGSLANTCNLLVSIYIFFLLSWGGNYYKDPLAKTWMPGMQKSVGTPKERLHAYKEELVAFANFLSKQLHITQVGYSKTKKMDVNDRATAYYRIYTTSRVKENGHHIKSTLFAPLLLRMGVDGYYNPFTGEGQVNEGQPKFMMPFLICHEMAHQAGIAAEGDANLMAYALCTTSDDVEFQYSAYFNLWLYTYNRLYRLDSSVALSLEAKLPLLTQLHIDTLQQIYQRYHGAMTEYTTDLYDGYLRMQLQEGIKSYGNVVKDAWHYEHWSGRNKSRLMVP